MTAIIQPTPIDLLPVGPRPIDTVEQFDAKSFATIEAQEAMIPQINAANEAAYQNALATEERAAAAEAYKSAAAASAGTATTEANRSRDEADRSRDRANDSAASAASSMASAAAAQSAAGLPSLAGNEGMALVVKLDGSGVGWGSVGFEVGGAYMGFKRPVTGVWLDPEVVYLKSSYTVLAAAVGVVHDGTFNSSASTLPASALWNATAYGDGKFVAVSGTAAAASSANAGVSWTSRTMPSAGPWLGVAHGNGKFVALGTTSGVGAISSDGENWAALVLPAGAWTVINFVGGKFVIFSSSATVATSTDGISWATGVLPAGTWEGCAFGNGKYVASGWLSSALRFATSVDGISWTLIVPAISPNYTLGKISFGNGVFVAIPASSISALGVYCSVDGLTWLYSPVFSGAYNDIKFGNGVFVLFGGGTNTTNTVYISRNGKEWVAYTLSASSSWRSIAFGDDTFILVSRAASSAATTVGNRVKVFSFDPATQFFLPLPFNAFGAAKQWVKAA